MSQAEFAHNDLPNKSTGKRPFQILYGMNPIRVSELRYLEKNEFKSVGEEEFTA
jgi:hypothetical protein